MTHVFRYDPRQPQREMTEAEMAGMSERDKQQQAKRDKLHASALKKAAEQAAKWKAGRK